MLSVVAIKLLGPFQLQCTFNDGAVKEIDFSHYWPDFAGPIFQPLRDPAFFKRVTLPPGSETIEWPNGADVAAEFLYEIGQSATQRQAVQSHAVPAT